MKLLHSGCRRESVRGGRSSACCCSGRRARSTIGRHGFSSRSSLRCRPVPTVYLGAAQPEALRRRMHAGPIAETRIAQKIATVGTMAMVIAVLVISALDHRFGWSQVPISVVVIGDILVAVGLAIATMVVNPEQLCSRHHHGGGGAAGGLHGPVWPRPAPDVRRRPDHDGRHAACARFLLGPGHSRARRGGARRSASTTRRRCFGGTCRVRRVHAEGALPVGARRLVTAGRPPHDEEHRDHREPQHGVRRSSWRSAPVSAHVDDVEDAAGPVQHHERRHDEPQGRPVGEPDRAERQHRDGEFRRGDEIDEQIVGPRRS